MDKTNDTESSSSSLNSLSTVTATDSTDNDNDIDDNINDNDMLIFENGTLLGAISCDSSTLAVNNSNNSYNSNSNNKPNNNNNNNNKSKSQQNLTTNSNSSTTSKLSSTFLKPILITKSMERISSSPYQNINNSSNCNNNSTAVENVLCNTTKTTQPTNIRILPNNNNNNNNNNNSSNNNDSIICTNNISNDLNTSLLDHNNYELDNNNLSVNNNCNSNNSNNNTSDNNSYIINMNSSNSNQIDLLNSSQCSFESHLNSISRNTLRTTTQHNKRFVETVATTAVNNTINPSNLITPPKKSTYTKLKSDQMQPHSEYYDSRYHPPQYTAIYFDAIGNPITSTNVGSTILNGNNNGVTSTSVNGNGIITNYYHHAMNRSYDNLNQIHHHQYITTAGSDLVANNIGIGNDMPIDSNQMYSGGINNGAMDGNRNGGAVDSIIPRRRGCFRQWFTRPSLPFVIGVLALGGVACTLGGIVLGSTGLVEHSTQYLSAALLMIGIGVSLLVISGAIWRLSIPDEVENCPCFRHLETCRNCNSPYCGNRLLTTHSGYMYPEFQHRPPPPSYLTSLNECTVGLLFHHEVANLQRSDSIRISTPPPAYRSSQSLSVFVPLHATVSPSQRSLIPELSMITTDPSTPLNTTTISLPDLEQIQTILSQSELNNSNELQGTLSQGSQNVMSTVHDNSCPLNKKNVLRHLSDITIE